MSECIKELKAFHLSMYNIYTNLTYFLVHNMSHIKKGNKSINIIIVQLIFHLDHFLFINVNTLLLMNSKVCIFQIHIFYIYY